MKYLILYVLIIIQQNLWTQNLSKDSVKKTIDLNEINICDEKEKDNQSFNFYRSNKLATTEDILSRMQGVNLIRRGAYGLEPTIRNYGSGQTNLTIDGMRIYGACTDKMDPVSIYVEPINLQSIQVAHGASGAQYGSTIGGQINLMFKEPTFNCHKKMSGQIAESYSTINNGSNTSISLQQSIKKIAYRISGAYRKADNYKDGSNTEIKHSGFEKINISAALTYQISKSQFLKLNCLGDWGKNIGYPALPMDVGKATAQIYSLTHQLFFNRTIFKLNEFKIYYNNIIHQMDDTQREDAPMHMDMPGWSNTYGLFNELSTKRNLKIRVDYHNAYTRADMTMYPLGEPVMYMQTLPENVLSDLGLSINRAFTLKYKQLIGVNGRIDVFNQYGNYGVGSKQWKVFNTDITTNKNDVLKNLNLTYGKYLGKITFLQLSLGYGERIATSNERYGYYLFNRQDQYDYMGNINLKPEKSYQIEFQFKQEYKKFEYALNLFYHQTNDYIYAYKMVGYSQMTIGAYGLKIYRNIDFATTKGLEGNFKFKLLEQLSYLGSIKFVYAETCFGSPLPLVPPFKLQHALRYTIKLFQIQLEHDYGMAQNRVNLDYGDNVTPDFHLFNLRFSRNFRIKETNLQAGIACENLFNQNYREHLDIGNINRFGRNFLLNLTFMF